MKGKSINSPRERILNFIEWVLLAVGLGLLTLHDFYSQNILVALAGLVGAFLIRWLRTGRFLTRTGVELPLALFSASAGLSTWAAYDRQVALLQLIRFFGTAVAFYALVDSSVKLRRLVAYGMALTAAFLAVYFVLRNDFMVEPSKFEFVTVIGRWLNANFPTIPGPSVHPNVAAGSIILGIPLVIALLMGSLKERRLGPIMLAGLMALAGLFGLLMTGSRGTWLALGGTFGLGVLVWIQRWWLEKRNAALIYWSGVAAIAFVSVTVLAQAGMLDRVVGQIPDPTGTLSGRTVIWKQGALLVGDYPFTGIGLLSFPMVFSTYTLLIHVPYLTHVHNTYLQVLIEQGWPGFMSVIGFGLVGLWWAWNLLRRKVVSILGWGSLAALTAVCLHALVDVPLYVARTLPLVGIVAGLLAAEYLLDAPGPILIKKRFYFAGLLFILAVGVIFWRPLAATAQANLGAVIQTRLELGIYDPNHFDQPTMDEIRRSIDLGSAQASFQSAIGLAPELTAAQRLSEIALSRGQYAAALEWMQAAWQNGARDEVTRLVYGDALVANGQPAAAADVVRGLTWAPGRLTGQAFYRYNRLGDYPRAVDAWKAAVFLNPADAHAAQGLENALRKLKP